MSRTLALYAFLGWAYVAALAVLKPDDLPRPLTHWAALRTDTFGEICFALSFVAFVAARPALVRGHMPRATAPGPRSLRGALVRAGCLYGGVAWAYIAMNAISHPRTLGMRLTHLAPWPTEGDFGVACFVVSAACHLLWQVLEPARPRRVGDEAVAAGEAPGAARS